MFKTSSNSKTTKLIGSPKDLIAEFLEENEDNLKCRGVIKESLELSTLGAFCPQNHKFMRTKSDFRTYREEGRFVKAEIPIIPVGPSDPVITSVDWKSVPSYQQLAYLYDNFFSKYDREVMMVMGKSRPEWEGTSKSKFFFMVPEQEGTTARIDWEDPKGMKWFSDYAIFLGTIHIHPGEWCGPSSTDLEDWSEHSKSGLHIIFGRDQGLTIHGSVKGHIFDLGQGTLKGVPREEVSIYRSRNRDLKDLLKEPRKLVQSGWKGWEKWKKDDQELEKEWDKKFKSDSEFSHFDREEELGDVCDHLSKAWSLSCEEYEQSTLEDIESLMIVEVKDQGVWILTECEYDNMVDELSQSGTVLEDVRVKRLIREKPKQTKKPRSASRKSSKGKKSDKGGSKKND